MLSLSQKAALFEVPACHVSGVAQRVGREHRGRATRHPENFAVPARIRRLLVSYSFFLICFLESFAPVIFNIHLFQRKWMAWLFLSTLILTSLNHATTMAGSILPSYAQEKIKHL